MTYQEKKSVVNIFSSLAISGVYFWYAITRYWSPTLETADNLKFWAAAILILIPITIVAKIVIHIVFGIFNEVATREGFPPEDERDKLIELKANRNSNYIFGAGFIMAMVALVLDFPVTYMFICIISFGLMAEIVSNLSQIYFYRKGV